MVFQLKRCLYFVHLDCFKYSIERVPSLTKHSKEYVQALRDATVRRGPIIIPNAAAPLP